MSERAAGILGIGWHLPPKVRGNDFWGTGFRRVADEGAAGNILAVERDSQGKMVTLPPEIAEAMAVFGDDPFRGARVRRVIADEAEPSDMEAAAAGEALRAAGIGPDEIDLVMVGSVPPDRLVAPSNAAAVQAKCGLSRATGWSVDVGCATFQAQLEAAVGLVRAGLYRRILLVVSSAVSRVIDYEHSISPMFGDAAAAVVIGDVPSGYGLIGRWSRTDGALREGVVLAPVADGVPHRRWDLVPGRIQVTTFDRVGAKRLGVRSTAYCREACLGALENAGLRIDDVALFVANQSVGWLVDACRRNLGLPREKVIDTFAEVANIGAAAIPYNLARAREEGRLRDGDVVLLYSPGAGFTWTANVIRWKEPGPGTVLDVRTNRS